MGKNKTIILPIYNIVIEIDKSGNGSITSNLKKGKISAKYRIAIDTLESIILAHALAGIEVESPAYLEGIETTIDGITNNL